MNKFIKVCQSSYGSYSCIYYYVNPKQIIEIHIEKKYIEATMTNGLKVIIMKIDDIKTLLNDKDADEILREVKNKNL